MSIYCMCTTILLCPMKDSLPYIFFVLVNITQAHRGIMEIPKKKIIMRSKKRFLPPQTESAPSQYIAHCYGSTTQNDLTISVIYERTSLCYNRKTIEDIGVWLFEWRDCIFLCLCANFLQKMSINKYNREFVCESWCSRKEILATKQLGDNINMKRDIEVQSYTINE